MPVDERALNDVLGWEGDVGDRSSGDGHAVFTSDDEGSQTGTLDRSSGGLGVGGTPSLIAAGVLGPPRLWWRRHPWGGFRLGRYQL